MEKQRVNKVTATLNENGGVTMTLYRTHTKLAQLTNDDISVPVYEESGATNKTTYMIYCKETLITLLQNDGVEGYYYSETDGQQSDIPKKFSEPLFIEWSKKIVDRMLGSMELDISIQTSIDNMMPEVTEKYKNGNIKYGSMKVSATMDTVKFNVPVFIKSGQLSKPKKIKYNDKEMGLNARTLKSILKQNGKSVKNKVEESQEIKEEIVENPKPIPQEIKEEIKQDIIKEEMTEKSQEHIEELTEEPQNTEVGEEIKEIKENIEELQEDVSNVKEEIKDVKSEVQNTKNSMRMTRRGNKPRANNANISKLMRAMKGDITQ